jgi:LPXTG-motif cell wall-anchored protein
MKKVISFIIAAALVITMCTAVSFAAEDYEYDLSSVECVSGATYDANRTAHGYAEVPTIILDYGNVMYLGNLDLSQYVSCDITYATDLGYIAQKEDMKIPANFSLKSNNVCIGAASQDPQTDGLIAQADCTDASILNPDGANWDKGERVCSIDLSNVDYSGDVWLSHFNSTRNQGLLVGIKLVAKEEAVAGARDFSKAKGDNLSYDWILVNGEKVADGNAEVIAKKVLIDGSDGSVNNIGMRGWFGNANSKIESYGYSIDGAEPVYGDFAVEAEAEVVAAGGESRFVVTVDVSGIKDGQTHVIRVVAKLQNGEIVTLNRFEADKDRDVYVNYKAVLDESQPQTDEPQPQTDEPQPQTDEPQPQTGDGAVAMIAAVAVLAMGAAVVFAKKRSF